MVNKYNKSPISLREGRILIDGIEVADGVKCQIIFTPDTWTGKQIGEKTKSTRWLGYTITGTITRRRSNNFLKDKIKEYKDRGVTPEMTIQGIMEDPGSDYYQEFGSDTVTAVGCVLTGGFTLTNLDSEGEILDDNISFNVYDLV